MEDVLQVTVLGCLDVWADYCTHHTAICHWDLVSLATERRDLMHPNAAADHWVVLDGIEPDPAAIKTYPGMDWAVWAAEFIGEYRKLALLVQVAAAHAIAKDPAT